MCKTLNSASNCFFFYVFSVNLSAPYHNHPFCIASGAKRRFASVDFLIPQFHAFYIACSFVIRGCESCKPFVIK